MEFLWHQHYPKNVPFEIGPLEYTSLVDLMEKTCERFPNRVAFTNFGVGLTFKEVDTLSTHFAAFLQKGLGLKKGERIALQIPNLLQYPVAFFGAIKAGLVVVNTNPLYTSVEMEHQFDDADISALVILSNFAHNVPIVLKKISVKHIIVTNIGDMLGPMKGPIFDFVTKYFKKMVPPYKIGDAISFKYALEKGAHFSLEKPAINLDDLCILQYTGGTTGVSRGAQLSHRNLVAHLKITELWFNTILDRNKQDVIITALPLYHIFALSVNGFLMFYTGCKNILVTNPRDIPSLVKTLRKEKWNIITGVSTLFNALLNNPDFHKVDFSGLKAAVGGGMAVQEDVAERWKLLTGKPLIEGYGLSETSPVLCCNSPVGGERLGYIGLPLPSTNMAVFNDAGEQLPPETEGEICASGPQVMTGYWRSHNQDVFFPGGWLRTGDIGLMTRDGFFKIVDRKKDMINISGFNVYPNEVEQALTKHPKVLEAAVVGITEQKGVERVKAFIVKKDNSLTIDELREFCASRLAPYKIPKIWEFRSFLPKTNVGKILRRALKSNT